MADPIVVDNTILSMTAKCSTLAVTRGVLGYTAKEESANLRAGSACHACWATYFRGGTADEALAALAACDDFEVWAGEHVEATDRLAFGNVSRIMRRWIETHPRERLPFVIDADKVEVYFESPLTDEGDIVYCGIMDALGQYNGAYYNIENKTTGRLDQSWLRAQRMSAQISGYHWLAEQYLGAPIAGTFINVQELSRLPSDPSRKCKEHGVAYAECGALHSKAEIGIDSRTPTRLAEWKKTAIHLAKKYRELLRYNDLGMIQKVRMQGTTNNSCRWCAFSEWCYMERDSGYAASNFTYDPWAPRERALARVGGSE